MNCYSLLYRQSVTADCKNTIEQWLNYFRYNREHLRAIAWSDPYCLTEEEKEIISDSIRKFQLGESSEGTHLMKVARAYAKQCGDLTYVETIKLFIGEEQRHAKDLGRFMQQQGITLAKKDWTDGTFRYLRKLSDLEAAVSILLTAELVAIIYYKALGKATRSPILSQLCQQITQDEIEHAYFQVSLLQQIRQHRPSWQHNFLTRLHRIFFSVTLLVVWHDHQSVFRASGYNFHQFWQENQLTFIHFCQTET